MPDTQIYYFFLDNGAGNPGTFLFARKLEISLRPKVGDSITIDETFDEYRIIRDETPNLVETISRITDTGETRVTDSALTRIIDETTTLQVTQDNIDQISHNYFITPANNPNRIVSWTTNKFEEDRTLDQLFR